MTAPRPLPATEARPPSLRSGPKIGPRFVDLGQASSGPTALADMIFRQAVIAQAEERNRRSNPVDYGKVGPNYRDYVSDRQKQKDADFAKWLNDIGNGLKDAAQRLFDRYPHLDPKKSSEGKESWHPEKTYGQPGKLYQVGYYRGSVMSWGEVRSANSGQFTVRAPFTGAIREEFPRATGDKSINIYMLSSALDGSLTQRTVISGTDSVYSGSLNGLPPYFGDIIGAITGIVSLDDGTPAPSDLSPGIEWAPPEPVILSPPETLPDTGYLPSLTPQKQVQPQRKTQPQTDPQKSPFPEAFPDLKPSPFPDLAPLPDIPGLPEPSPSPVPTANPDRSPLGRPSGNPSSPAQRGPKIEPVKSPQTDPGTATKTVLNPPNAPTKTTQDRCKDPCVQGLHDKLDDMNNQSQNDPEITIKVFKACTKLNEAGETVKEIDFDEVTLIVPEAEADAYQILYDRIFALESQKCDPCHSVAVVPDWWQVRTGADRPQLVIVYANVINGKRGRSRWSVMVPHFNTQLKGRRDYPKYKKGSCFATLTLVDNSKLTINAETEQEAERTVKALSSFINPAMLPPDVNNLDIHTGKRKGKALSVVDVEPVTLSYFSTGQRNMMPDWVIDL
jgi:hypothetical protein